MTQAHESDDITFLFGADAAAHHDIHVISYLQQQLQKTLVLVYQQ